MSVPHKDDTARYLLEVGGGVSESGVCSFMRPLECPRPLKGEDARTATAAAAPRDHGPRVFLQLRFPRGQRTELLLPLGHAHLALLIVLLGIDCCIRVDVLCLECFGLFTVE